MNKVRREPPLTPAKLVELLGYQDALAAENWFTWHEVPGFMDLNTLSGLLGCCAEWLKFGERVPFPMSSQSRINWKGRRTEDVDALLAPNAKGNPVTFVRIIRLTNSAGNTLILREFKDTLSTDFFTPNFI